MSSTENPMLTPRITKVTVNIGVGREATDSFWLKRSWNH